MEFTLSKGFFGLLRLLSGLGATTIALSFSTPRITIAPETVTVCGELQGAMNERVQRVIDTGTPVEIEFQAHFLALSRPRQTITVRQVIHYDALEESYTVVRGEQRTRFMSRATAEAAMSSYCWRFEGSDLPQQLEVEGEARIHYRSTVNVDEAAEGLWDHLTPYIRITDLRGDGGA